MEVKQEPEDCFDEENKVEDPEDCFDEENKVDIEEHLISDEITRECWNNEQGNTKLCSTVKNEFVSIKRENETNFRVDNLQQTYIEGKNEINQTIDDGNIKCNSVELSNIKRSKKGLSLDGKRIKKKDPSGRFFLCIVCGYICKRKVEFLSHFSSNHFVNQKNLLRTKIKREDENVIKSQVSYRGISIDADVKDEIEIVDHELKEELEEIGKHANLFKNIDGPKTLESGCCYNKHLRSHLEEKPDIGSSFFTQKRHLNINLCTHSVENPFKCNVCTKSFSGKGNLNKHLRTHTGEKPFNCNVCTNSFSHKANLKKHLRTHTGEKPFKCDICTKSFSQEGHLTGHLRTHTGEKPFKCYVCTKSFSGKSNLSKHLRTHTGEKPYKCNVCAKSFSLKGNLNLHMRTHTGEKPFICNVCTKSFSHEGNLKCHLRTHSEKPFKCNICTKSFSQKAILRKHLRIHPGVKPFECE